MKHARVTGKVKQERQTLLYCKCVLDATWSYLILHNAHACLLNCHLGQRNALGTCSESRGLEDLVHLNHTWVQTSVQDMGELC